MQVFSIAERWCVLGYYTACHYAPDGSGRILLAGTDLETGIGHVYILAPSGEILERFGDRRVTDDFFHVGFTQQWSYDGKSVYYQYFEDALYSQPRLVRRDLLTGQEDIIHGHTENVPPPGAPLLSGNLPMLYASGYCDLVYHPELAPVPFQAREDHGLFEYSWDSSTPELRLSVAEILERHPERDTLASLDAEVKRRHGKADGLTLMLYCVRWNSSGTRCLFYFGNHLVSSVREEPRVGYVFTANSDLEDLHLVVDLSFGRPGNHWSWHPNGECVIGNGPDPTDPTKSSIVQVSHEGTDYRRLSHYTGGGHPSISPTDHKLLVTDNYGYPDGEVVFIDLEDGEVIQRHAFPRATRSLPGRHRFQCNHHPSFSRDGSRVLINALLGSYAYVCEIGAPQRLPERSWQSTGD